MSSIFHRRLNEPGSSSGAESQGSKKGFFRKLKTRVRNRLARKADRALATFRRFPVKVNKAQVADVINTADTELLIHQQGIQTPGGRAAAELQTVLETDGIEVQYADTTQLQCSTEIVIIPSSPAAQPERQFGPRPDWHNDEPEDWQTSAPPGEYSNLELRTSLASVLGNADMPHWCLAVAAPRWPLGNDSSGNGKLTVSEILRDDGIVKGRDPEICFNLDCYQAKCLCSESICRSLPVRNRDVPRPPTPWPRGELYSYDSSSMSTSWDGEDYSYKSVEEKPIPQQALNDQWIEHRQGVLAHSSHTAEEDSPFPMNSAERLIHVQAVWSFWRKRAAALAAKVPESLTSVDEYGLSTASPETKDREAESQPLFRHGEPIDGVNANCALQEIDSGYATSSNRSTPFDCRSFTEIEDFLKGLGRRLLPSSDSTPPTSPKLRYTLKGLVDDSLPQPTPSPEPEYQDRDSAWPGCYTSAFSYDSQDEESDDDASAFGLSDSGDEHIDEANPFADSAAVPAGGYTEPFKDHSSPIQALRAPIARKVGPAIQALLKIYEGDISTATTKVGVVSEDHFSCSSEETVAGQTGQLRPLAHHSFRKIPVPPRPVQQISLLTNALNTVSQSAAGVLRRTMALPSHFTAADLGSAFDDDSDDEEFDYEDSEDEDYDDE